MIFINKFYFADFAYIFHLLLLSFKFNINISLWIIYILGPITINTGG